MSNKNKKDNNDKEIEKINTVVDEITKQIEKNLYLENSLHNSTIKQQNAVNPRLPYPYNTKKNIKPSLTTNNQVRYNSELYNKSNQNTSGCTACRHRVWDPL